MVLSVCLIIMGACEVAVLSLFSIVHILLTRSLFSTGELGMKLNAKTFSSLKNKGILELIKYQQRSIFLESTIKYRYGYNGLLDKLRKKDFSRFSNSVYLDYTGNQAIPYFRLIKQVLDNIGIRNLQNPLRSFKKPRLEIRIVIVLQAKTQKLKQMYISFNPFLMQQKARQLVLKWFHTTEEEYEVIFTSGTTGILHYFTFIGSWSSFGGRNVPLDKTLQFLLPSREP